MAKEKNLTAVTSVAAADFARVVTSAGASVKATFANIAKYIIETYNGSTVAGSAQSVKSALDSLNSNLKRKIVNYSNITIPSVGYVKIDSFSSLGVSSDLFLISMEIRGWNGNSVPQIVKGQNGTDIYAVGASGTYPSFGVEYYFAVSAATL